MARIFILHNIYSEKRHEKKEIQKFSSICWYFLQCDVAMNGFKIFFRKYYIFSAMQLFLHNLKKFTLWQCSWLKLRKTLFSDHYKSQCKI